VKALHYSFIHMISQLGRLKNSNADKSTQNRSAELTALLSELQTYEELVCQPLNVNSDRGARGRSRSLELR
jgi:hypothetical protein